MDTPALPAAPAADHDPYFDNAKWLLVWLMMVCHGLTLLPAQTDLTNGIYKALGVFVTPTFAFISGVFSKAEISPERALKLACATLLPYFAFQAILSIENNVAYGYPLVEYQLFSPRFALWYLPALFTWRLLLPLIARLRHPLLFSLAVALAAGFLPDSSVSFVNVRTFAVLPFFVAGYVLGKNRESVKQLTRPVLRIAGAALLILAGAIAWKYGKEIPWVWILPEQTARQLALSSPEWLGIRGACLVAAALACAAFLALVPRGRTFFTGLGAGTFYVYLLHIPVVALFMAKPWLDPPIAKIGHIGLQVGLVVAVTLVVALVLSQRPIRFLFRPLVEPSPDLVRRIAPLLLAIPIGLSFIPSFSYLGASEYRDSEIPPSVVALQSPERQPRMMGTAGIIVSLRRASNAERVTIGVDCVGAYQITLFYGVVRRGVLRTEISTTARPQPVDVPAAIARGAYTTLVIEPTAVSAACRENVHLTALKLGAKPKPKQNQPAAGTRGKKPEKKIMPAGG